MMHTLDITEIRRRTPRLAPRGPVILRAVGPTLSAELQIQRVVTGFLREAAVICRDDVLPAVRGAKEELAAVDAASFEEHEHPRGSGGKFSEKPDGDPLLKRWARKSSESTGIEYVGDNVVKMSPSKYLELAVPFGHAGGRPLQEKTIEELVGVKKFDKNPMLSVKERSDGRLQVGLHDGRHRAEAARRRGDETINVDIVRGMKFKREHPDVSDADMAKRVADEGLLPELFKDARVADSLTRLQRELDRFRQFLEAHGVQVTPRISELLRVEEVRHRTAFVRTLKAASAIDADLVMSAGDVAAQVRVAAEASASLIKGLTDELSKRVANIVLDGARKGTRSTTLAKELQRQFKFSNTRARLIARDQLASFNASLNKVRQKQVGVKKYVWSTSLDERVRKLHAEREGRTFSWSNPPEDGHPGEPINCRCVARAVIE